MLDQSNLTDAAQRLTGLELQARRIVDGFLTGRHRGPRRGSAAEFAEHREYTPGDDLRYLDWKVYGKHDRYYLRQLEQESKLACHLLLDASGSMRYRSEAAPLSKLDTACLAAAALAALVLRQHDEVSLATFGASPAIRLPASSQPAQFQQLVDRLESLSATVPPAVAASDSDARPALADLHPWAEQTRRRGVVIVLSDCLGELNATLDALRRLRSGRHDILLVHVVDPAEQDFPFLEPTQFHDLETARMQSVDCRQLRDAYCAEFEAFRRQLQSECGEMGGDYLLLRTDAPIDTCLAALLARRARKGLTG